MVTKMTCLEQKAWQLYCRDLGSPNTPWDQLAEVSKTKYLQMAAALDDGKPMPHWQRYDLPRESRMTYVLRQILYDLPEKRDWLHPELERIARELVR